MNEKFNEKFNVKIRLPAKATYFESKLGSKTQHKLKVNDGDTILLSEIYMCTWSDDKYKLDTHRGTRLRWKSERDPEFEQQFVCFPYLNIDHDCIHDIILIKLHDLIEITSNNTAAIADMQQRLATLTSHLETILVERLPDSKPIDE